MCRAEPWALHNIMDVWSGGFPLEVVNDAIDSISGVDLEHQDNNLKGANADIWTVIYQKLEVAQSLETNSRK